MELLVAMPLLTMLLAGMAAAVGFGLRSYVRVRSDSELVSQLRVPLERLTRDLSCAEDVKILGSRLYVYCRNSSEAPQWVCYELADGDKAWPKVSRAGQPLTGDSRLGKIRISRMSFEIDGRTVYVELSGSNLLTKKECTLHTAVTLPYRDST